MPLPDHYNKRLSEDARDARICEILSLKADGQTFREISAAMSIPMGTVRTAYYQHRDSPPNEINEWVVMRRRVQAAGGLFI